MTTYNVFKIGYQNKTTITYISCIKLTHKPTKEDVINLLTKDNLEKAKELDDYYYFVDKNDTNHILPHHDDILNNPDKYLLCFCLFEDKEDDPEWSLDKESFFKEFIPVVKAYDIKKPEESYDNIMKYLDPLWNKKWANDLWHKKDKDIPQEFINVLNNFDKKLQEFVIGAITDGECLLDYDSLYELCN